MKRLLPLLLALLMLAGCAAPQAPEQTTAPTTDPTTAAATLPPKPTEEGYQQAPDFTVYDGEGKPLKLSDFRGQPVILNFWASWCPPCKAEMPDFQEAYQAHGDQIAFLMVNLTDGQQETVDTASAFISQSGYTFPVYYDTASEAAYAYGIRSIPTTFFINSEGQIVAMGSGMLDAAAIDQGISLLLN